MGWRSRRFQEINTKGFLEYELFFFFFARNCVAFAFIFFFFVIFNFITCIVVVLGLVAGFIVFWWTKLSSTCDPSSFSPVKRLSFYLANRQLNSAPPLLHPAPLFFFWKLQPTSSIFLLCFPSSSLSSESPAKINSSSHNHRRSKVSPNQCHISSSPSPTLHPHVHFITFLF